MEQLEILTVSGNANSSVTSETVWQFVIKLNINFPGNPATHFQV